MPAKPKSPFPNPAAVLPGEADILATVLADLSDHNAKLVYADWLEERDDKRGPLLRTFLAAQQSGKKFPAVSSVSRSWRDLVGITLLANIREEKFTDHTDALLKLAKPALTFKASKTPEAKLAVGVSKLGGQPDLPPGTKWPLYQRSPLAFLAQFNLDELSASAVCRELPATGALSVFYAASGEVFDNDDKGGWRVFHFPDTSKLTRQDFPEELGESDRFKPCRLSFTELLTLPDRDSPWEGLLPPHDSMKDYVTDRYQHLFGKADLGHRVLGYASNLQNDVHGRKNIRHLLTIDSDDKPGWMWGDAGLLYFMISDDNLQKHRFDRTRFEMQCC